KAAIERVARERKCSEAEVIREAVARDVGERSGASVPLPTFGLFEGEPDWSENVDALLEGFGER
ncbi:MAG: antitoxin, partial [Dehalococcoidia bacterium]